MTTPTADDLVLLRTCADNAEASLVQGLLESNGIFSVISGEEHRSLLGKVGTFIELRILVRRADLDAATKLLAST
jgi:hypothetical protein